jgi:hypothetical protein
VELPYSHGFSVNSRGLGMADLAHAIRSGRPHRANGELASYVLDITLGIFDASRTERHVAITLRCDRPRPCRRGCPTTNLTPIAKCKKIDPMAWL